jgi:hypothetical protein
MGVRGYFASMFTGIEFVTAPGDVITGINVIPQTGHLPGLSSWM